MYKLISNILEVAKVTISNQEPRLSKHKFSDIKYLSVAIYFYIDIKGISKIVTKSYIFLSECVDFSLLPIRFSPLSLF